METNKKNEYPPILEDQEIVVIRDIILERRKQDHKWGEQNHTPVEWIAILSEEVGEASREAVDLHFSNPSKNPVISGQSLANQRISDFRKELVQVAAVAVQIIENIDRDQRSQFNTIYTIRHQNPQPTTHN